MLFLKSVVFAWLSLAVEKSLMHFSCIDYGLVLDSRTVLYFLFLRSLNIQCRLCSWSGDCHVLCLFKL